MQMVSVDIMHPQMDLENTSPLDPETHPPLLDPETDPPPLDPETDPPPLDPETDLSPLDHETDLPPLDPETDPPPLDLKTDPCPEASHSPALSDLHADQPQAFQTSHPPAHSFLANHPPIGFTFTEDVKTKSSSDIPTKVGSLQLHQNSCIFLD